MSSIRGVNVGGNLFDVTDSSNVAPIQLTNFATRAYAKDRCFIMADGLLYRATAEIESGDPIVINGNCKRTTLDEIISVLETDSDLIAPTEDGATSSDDYVVGDEIVRSGILYKVISDITQGDAFAIGSNIDIAGSLTSQIQTLTNNDDAMLNVLGAKNLLPNDAKSQTKNDVTMTVNSDGTITLSGTASATTFFDITRANLNFGSDSILTGAPNDRIRLVAYDGTSYFQDLGRGVAVPKGAYQLVEIIITENTDTTGAKLYPMIRPATVTDNTYVPYAKTNKELTDGRLRYLDYTISSNTYNANGHATAQGSKSNVFGLPNAAKIVSVTLMDNNYHVIVFGWNDFPESQYLRIFLYNRTASAITTALPVRIFYEL